MTEGMIEVLGGVAMMVGLLAQVGDAILTMKGMDVGDVEVGIVNRYFIKSKADEGKVPVVTFVEAGVTLVIFGAISVYAGADMGLLAASIMAGAEIANDIRSVLLLKKQKAL